MTEAFDKDALVDRALRQALRAPDAADVTAACLDAERMAAWMDGGLPDAEQAAAQSHIAGCARCRALAGAMARAELATPALSTIGQSRRWIGWAIPLATAAVIVVAALLPRQPVTPSVPTAKAPAPQAAAPPPAPEPAPRAAAPVEPKLTAEAPSRDKAAREENLAKREDTQKLLDKKDQAEGRLQQNVAAPVIEIQSTGSAVRWRVRGNLVERSTDSGAIWLPLATMTEIDARTSEVLAGSSPSATVCWFVGRRGLVLLSTDGHTVQRLTFSEMTDLSAVTAADATTATVTTADGRTFHTTDAGKTWIRRLLQDF